LDKQEVELFYLREVEELVKQLTKCAKVIAFDFTLRIDDPARQKLYDSRAPVPALHNDFTAASCAQRVKDLLGEGSIHEMFSCLNHCLTVKRVSVSPIWIDQHLAAHRGESGDVSSCVCGCALNARGGLSSV
jgi:hypothetical protein